MQAIILAAGMGRRLGALTRDNTKCMVPVCGERIIDRTLRALADLRQVRRVIIVVGYQADNLRTHIGSRYEADFSVEYVENRDFATTNNIYSLSLVSEQLQEDDTLLLESDLVFDPAMLRRLVDHPDPNLALVARYESWMDGTMVRIDDERNIVNFISKKAFRYEDTPAYYKTVNIYKFSRGFSRRRYVPFLHAYQQAVGTSEYYEQVLRVLALLDSTELKALPIDPMKWYEIDDVQDLDIAEVMFAPQAEKLSRYTRRFGGYWRFPYLRDFCYLVNPYFPPARLKDELRSASDTLLTEYPSGMRVCTLLAAKCFGVSPDHILPAGGAAELIRIVMEREQGKVGMVWPTFEEYPNRLREEQRVVFTPSRPGFRYTVDDLMQFFGENPVSLLVVINPDNPSGNFLSRADVLRLATWTGQHGIRLLVDESFLDFSQAGVEDTLIDDATLEAHPGMIVIKSISKSYGVPGIRLGVLASGDTGYLQYVREAMPIWSINSYGEFFMQIYNKYEADYRQSHAKFLATRERFRKALEEIPFLHVWPTEANYFLVEVIPPMNSTILTKRLLEDDDILIKDCSTKKAFNGRSFVRIAVRDDADNDLLVTSLKKMI